MLLLGLSASPCILPMYGYLLLRGVSARAGREAFGGQVLVKKRHPSGSLVLGLVFLWGAYPILLCCNITMIYHRWISDGEAFVQYHTYLNAASQHLTLSHKSMNKRSL